MRMADLGYTAAEDDQSHEDYGRVDDPVKEDILGNVDPIQASGVFVDVADIGFVAMRFMMGKGLHVGVQRRRSWAFDEVYPVDSN